MLYPVRRYVKRFQQSLRISTSHLVGLLSQNGGIALQLTGLNPFGERRMRKWRTPEQRQYHAQDQPKFVIPPRDMRTFMLCDEVKFRFGESFKI